MSTFVGCIVFIFMAGILAGEVELLTDDRAPRPRPGVAIHCFGVLNFGNRCRTYTGGRDETRNDDQTSSRYGTLLRLMK